MTGKYRGHDISVLQEVLADEFVKDFQEATKIINAFLKSVDDTGHITIGFWEMQRLLDIAYDFLVTVDALHEVNQ